MNLDFSKDQLLIRKSAGEFLKKECPYEKVKELEESEAGYDHKLWKKMAELDWQASCFPEAYGGYGGSFVDVIILMEEMGKMAFPSPFFSTVIQCGQLVLLGGTEKQKKSYIPRLIDGDLIMALAQYETDGSYDPEDITMKAVTDGNYTILNGTKLFVTDANIAHKLIVAAKTGAEGLSLFVVDAQDPGIAVTKMPTIGKDNNCEVIFTDVKVSRENILGSPGGGAALLVQMNTRAMVAKAAEMLGGCKAATDMTIAYAKQRKQYGMPIGSYQVIQHYIANMLMEYDTASNYLYWVAGMVDAGEDYAMDAAALKACVNHGFKYVSERAVQIHGGLGTSREAHVGLFYRRAKSCEFVCGDTRTHQERVFQGLLKRKP